MRVLLSCGEPSGDLYAGALTTELRAARPDLVVTGIGGPQLAAAGGRLLADYRGLAVTGLAEALPVVRTFFAVRRRVVESVRAERPDVLVLVDAPDLNFRIARAVRQLGTDVPIVYYISPQIWAWRSGRVDTIRRLVDRMLVIFPFEEDLYRAAGVPVEFVGHPLVDLARPSQPRAALLERLGLDASPSARTVAVLPGSRPNEVRRILPELVKACRLVAARVRGTQFVLARAPQLDTGLFAPLADLAGVPVRTIEGETDAVLASSDVALTASGTATVQAALHGTPMVIVYRLSSLTYRLGRPLVKVTTFGMVNVIAGSHIVPELIQDAFTAEAVADQAVSLLTDVERAESTRLALAKVRQALGAPGASRRAAEAVLRAVGREESQPCRQNP